MVGRNLAEVFLAYRIVKEDGTIIYDGKTAFTYRNSSFTSEPTVIEGPLINKLTDKGAVNSFTTSQKTKANIEINGQIYRDRTAGFKHEISINKLEAGKLYHYALKVGEFSF